MEVQYTILLAVAAYLLGACPFSVWVGRWLLKKDIRAYGDGNPGSANVFRAGGRKVGSLALALDIAKGVPVVALAHTLFDLSGPMVLAVALGAVLGHSFSPLLRFRGGKAVAVTFGALIALPQHELLVVFAVFMILGFLFIEVDAWTTMLAPIGSLAYLLSVKGNSWESLFMLCVLVVFGVRNFSELQTVPKIKGRLIQ